MRSAPGRRDGGDLTMVKSVNLAVIGIFTGIGMSVGGNIGWYCYLSQPDPETAGEQAYYMLMGSLSGAIIGALAGYTLTAFSTS